MAVNFGGGETSSFAIFNSIETTLAGTFKTPARCGIHTRKGGWVKATFAAMNSQWYHFDMHVGLITPELTPIMISDSANTPLFSIMSNGVIKAGATQIGIVPIFTPGLFTIDIRLVNGVSGIAEVYANGQPVFSATGNFNFTGQRFLTFTPIGTNATDVTDSVWSQVIVSDEPTIGNELATLVFTAPGNNSEWAGQVADINEISLNTTTYINAATTGLVNTFTTSDLAPQYTNIRAVIVSALARYSTVGPRNLDSVVRIGTTNYLNNMTPLGVGLTPSQVILQTRPSDNATWTRDDVNNAQFGLRSRT